MNNFASFSLAQWLHYLENRHALEIEFGLDRIRAVADELALRRLGDCVVITVGGTNGKGSTVAALEAIYASAGYCVGAYTSPHLLQFNERIRVNTKCISDEELCTAFQYISGSDQSPTLKYFEAVTLAALFHFKQKNCDVVILEVGMGGRLDATNIIDSDLAIITTVDYDHQEYLGETKEEIAYNKAGILRNEKPFIYADYAPPNTITSEASLHKNKMFCLGKDYTYSIRAGQLFLNLYDNVLYSLPAPNLNLKAASAAVLTAYQLSFVRPVSTKALIEAMQSVSIKGRQQTFIENGIITLVDVAHNCQAAQLLAEKVKDLGPEGKVHAVFAALKDKDLRGLISSLSACVDFWYPAILDGKRASSKSQLMEAFNVVMSLEPNCFDSPYAAYATAKMRAKAGDLIIVYGSFLTVEAVMKVTMNA